VSVAFGSRAALKEVSLELRTDRISVIVGPSGSGKTTLLRCLNRLNELYPDHRMQGRVELTLDGRAFDVHAPDVRVTELRRRVAMVFQSPNVLPVSVERNLEIPLRLVRGIRGTEARDRIESALAEAGLWEEVEDRLRESALHLSGGQQQRLCLARALVLEPAVLLLDEPTASLDFRAARRIEERITALKGRYAVVAVSHGVGQAARLADEVFVLADGRLVEHVPPCALEDPGHLERLVESLF
jgi:phosphate transport system ATP-binding protein